MKLSILILAAGNSSRLGQPKQLIEFEGKTLIERITETALTISKEILVVLGGNSSLITPKLERLEDRISILFNPDWQEGIGTSIRKGVEFLANKSDSILILLSDQPLVNQGLIEKMIETFESTKCPIITCHYGNQLGVPMLFDKTVFPELLKLSGDKGAKSFLSSFQDKIATVDFPEGSFDIDTEEDIEKLRSFEI
jgi:molybdenum cofactor cytidylyltransferase